MTTAEQEQQLVEGWRALPADRQQEVLDFLEFLRSRTRPHRPLRSALGLCADLGASISDEDIAQVREEMWAGFPREVDV